MISLEASRKQALREGFSYIRVRFSGFTTVEKTKDKSVITKSIADFSIDVYINDDNGFINLTKLYNLLQENFKFESKMQFCSWKTGGPRVKAIDSLALRLFGHPNFIYENSHIYTTPVSIEQLTPEIIQRSSIKKTLQTSSKLNICNDYNKNDNRRKDKLYSHEFDQSLFSREYDGAENELKGSYGRLELVRLILESINEKLDSKTKFTDELIDRFISFFSQASVQPIIEVQQAPVQQVETQSFEIGIQTNQIPFIQENEIETDDPLVFDLEVLRTLDGESKDNEEYCINEFNKLLGISLVQNRSTRGGMDGADFINKVMLEVKYKKNDSIHAFERKFESDIKDIIKKAYNSAKLFIYINLCPDIDFPSSFVPAPVPGALIFKAYSSTLRMHHIQSLKDAIAMSKSHGTYVKSSGFTASHEETIDEKIDFALERRELDRQEQEAREIEIRRRKILEGRVTFNPSKFCNIESFTIVTKYLISRVPLTEDKDFIQIQHTFEQYICDYSLLVITRKLSITEFMNSIGVYSHSSKEWARISLFISKHYNCNPIGKGKGEGAGNRSICFKKVKGTDLVNESVCGIPYESSRDMKLRMENNGLGSFKSEKILSKATIEKVKAVENLEIVDIEPRDYTIHMCQGSQSSNNLIEFLGMFVKYVADNPNISSIEEIGSKVCLQLRDSRDTNKYNIRTIYNKFSKDERLLPLSKKMEEIIGTKDIVHIRIRQGLNFVHDVGELLKRCLNEHIHFSKVSIHFEGGNGVSSLMGLYDAQCPSIETKGGFVIQNVGDEIRSFKLNFLNKRMEILKEVGSEVINQLRIEGLSVKIKKDGRTNDALRMFDMNNM